MASYIQNKSNRLWSARFRIIENGKEVNKRLSGYKTKKDAIASYTDYMANYVAPIKEAGEPFDITFDELYKAYLKHKKSMIKASSLYDLTSNYKKHIAPYFADKKLIKINKNDCINFYNYLNASNYAFKTKKKLRLYVSSVLNYGVKYYDLPYNIMLKIDGFRNTEIKKEMLIWSKEEFQTFIKTVNAEIFKNLFELLYFTGCRKGEALALNWLDVNFKDNILSINKSLTRKCENSSYEITTPKNKSSVRKIIIPQYLSNRLQTLKEHSNSEMIFANDNIPLAENTITRYFKRHCELAKVKKIRIHDLRHSHASLLISQGESIVLVAKRLGHTNIEQTLNTYSHLMPSEEKQMIDRLNTMWQDEL